VKYLDNPDILVNVACLSETIITLDNIKLFYEELIEAVCSGMTARLLVEVHYSWWNRTLFKPTNPQRCRA